MANRGDDFERKVNGAYGRFGDLAKRYYYTFKRTAVTCGETPCMIFLGNHSSGKSSLINWAMGGEPVQDVGLAPTDDGFTVIMYGKDEEDVCGPAAVSRLPREFRELDMFGGTFLQHLKVKIRNREILKTVTFIDSPGMIDSAEGTASRTYDFEGVVKMLAEICDMVFFLLDPDKPGTTGETINVFAKCLMGSEFKLRVMLNKCDAFTSMYDFARTYGTACWNLARVLRTKDLPKIWTIYSGEEKKSDGGQFAFEDFNRHRAEFLDVLHNAAARRHDNVFSQVLSDLLRLSVRMCVVNHAARRLAFLRASIFGFGALVLSAVGLAAWLVLTMRFGWGKGLSWSASGLVVALGLLLTYGLSRLSVRNLRNTLAREVDDIFAREYRRKLVIGTHDNLRQYWDAVREETAEVIRHAPLNLPLFGEFRRKRLDAAVARLCASFHGEG